MAEYTPTTEQVKNLYHLGAIDVGPDVNIEETLAMFDRWLAEVQAAAWEQGFIAGDEASTGHLTSNPYWKNE